MELHILEEFIDIAYAGSFKEVADQRFMASSTLSNHIKGLERELGFDLFDRSKGIELTDAGALFLNLIKGHVYDINSAIGTCRGIADPPTQDVVRIASCMWKDEIAACLQKDLATPFVFVPRENNAPELRPFAQDSVDIMLVFNQHRFADQIKEMEKLGLTYEFGGVVECGIAMAAANPLASGKLTRERLRQAEVLITSTAQFIHWSEVVNDMLGRDLELTFGIQTVAHYDDHRTIDLGNRIVVSPIKTLEELYGGRDDCIIRTLVDDKPFFYERDLIYPQHPRNEAVNHAVRALRVLVEETRSVRDSSQTPATDK